jgi:hypothetical protein
MVYLRLLKQEERDNPDAIIAGLQQWLHISLSSGLG